MAGTEKRIVSQGSVYFLGNILRHAISFVMLPIYTRVLTPADYGTIELLSMVIDFAGIIFGLKIGEAIFRFYSDYDDSRRKHQVISTALLLAVSLNAIGFFVIWGGAGHISHLLFGGQEERLLIVIFSLSLMFQPLVEIPMTFIRAQQRPWLFVGASSTKLLLQLTLNILLIVHLGWGVKGVIISSVISTAVMATLLSGYCISVTGIKFSVDQAKSLVAFSYPMILASMISFYITFGDRWFLNHYGSLTDVGLYALGYKFGFLLSFIGTGPFFSIWESERYRVYKSPHAKETYGSVFLLFTAFASIMVLVISVFSKSILMVMASPEFWDAYKIVPIVLIAYFLQGWMGYSNLGILIHKKTLYMTKSTLLSAAVITVLYVILIPKYGAYGAAWATVITFLARFLYINFHASRLYDMELPWKKAVLLVVPCLMGLLISYLGPSHIILQIPFNLILVFTVVYVCSMLPVFAESQRQFLRRILFRPWMVPKELRLMFKGA